jgi:predicted amidohydrolase YtcJ
VTAELIVTGRIATLAGERGFGWAHGLAIEGGRVVAVGTNDDVEATRRPGTRTIQLAPDEVAIPGLTDAHLHLAEVGLSTGRVDLGGAQTLTDALALIAELNAVLPVGTWLQGHGWGPDRWDGWPSADDLSTAAPGRRIALWAHDHHSLWVSHAALRAAHVDHDTPDPDGGIIRRLADGSPSGILHENATRLVTAIIPTPTRDEFASGIRRTAAALVALGVVAVHDPGSLSLQAGLGPAFDAYRVLAEREDLPIRVHVCIRESQLDEALRAGLHSGDRLDPPIGRLTFGWLKLFADGTLGSRTAALMEQLEPDADRPHSEGFDRGIWTTEPAVLAKTAALAAENGIATMIHAIGDRAVRASLDALAPTAGRTRLMPRVEHIQLIHPDDRPRFARDGIAASVQPIHLRADARIARQTWGERAEARGYPLASLLDAGAVLAFGTDAPVETVDPWPGLETAVTRRSPDWRPGTRAFGPHEALPLDLALRAACLGGSTVAGEPDRGRLTAGQRADLAVIPAAALDEPVEVGGPLGRVRPRLVLVDGDVASSG